MSVNDPLSICVIFCVTGTLESQWASIILQQCCPEYASKKERRRNTLKTASANHDSETIYLDMRAIIAVSGHKCETSLQSYWRSKFGGWRKWSNILATPSNTRPLNQKCKPTSSKSPTEAGKFFSNTQININK